jgi:S1-C subfamily serine protease
MPVTGRTAETLGVKAGEGLYIEAVEAGSPAAEARLQSGFLVLGLEGQRTGDLRRFAGLLIDRKKGESLRLAVVVPRKVGGYVEFRQGVVELRLR